jgi:glycopeptide antibiotics resistance protein
MNPMSSMGGEYGPGGVVRQSALDASVRNRTTSAIGSRIDVFRTPEPDGGAYIACVSATKPQPSIHRHPRLATILSARSAYIVIILIATLASLEPNWHDGLAGQRLARAIHPQHFTWNDTIDAVRNVLLFAGFGAVWEVTTRLRLRSALWRATLYGCLLSATVETLQLFSPVRFSSILDVITNTSGTFLGALGVAVLVASVRAGRKRDTYLGVPAFLLALGLVAAVAIEGVLPLFRQAYVPGVSGPPLTRLRTALAFARPVTFTPLPRSDFGLSIPAGFVAVAALMELGVSRWVATVLVVLGGSVLAVVTELAHGAVGALIVWPAVFALSLGMSVGAVVAALTVRRFLRVDELTRVRVFIGAYATVVVGWLWRPFAPRASWPAIAAQLTRPHWIPMAAFGGGGSPFDIGQIIQLGFLFIPLGAMLEAWPARERGLMRWLMPGVWLAAIVGAGQIFIEGRTFDITNCLIMVAGVWIGWWIARRAGVPRRGTWLAQR